MKSTKNEKFQYTYRSVNGLDITVTVIVPKGYSCKKHIEDTKKNFRNSVTPLVSIDGVPIDITQFLQNKISCNLQEIERLKTLNMRMTNEMFRRQRENLDFEKKSATISK